MTITTKLTDSSLLLRIAAIIILIAAFAFMSSIINPDDSVASGTLKKDGSATPSMPTAGAADIGIIDAGSHRIRIHADYPHPTYTIIAQDGRIAAERISAVEVALRFPDLPILAGSDPEWETGSSARSSAKRERDILMGDVPVEIEESHINPR